MKLEQEGLVIGERNRGYSVMDLDVDAVRDLLVVREALDVCAAELACKTAKEKDLDLLREIIEEMSQLRKKNSGKPEDIAHELELGIRIHFIIAESTGNRMLIKLSKQVYEQLQLALWLEVYWLDLPDNGFEEHKAIASAIIAGDAAAAGEAARAHVRGSLANMDKVQQIYQVRRSALGKLPSALAASAE